MWMNPSKILFQYPFSSDFWMSKMNLCGGLKIVTCFLTWILCCLIHVSTRPWCPIITSNIIVFIYKGVLVTYLYLYQYLSTCIYHLSIYLYLSIKTCIYTSISSVPLEDLNEFRIIVNHLSLAHCLF